MTGMPRPRRPYVLREVDRHGNTRWYYRKGKGKRYRLPGQYESREWIEAYNLASSGQQPPSHEMHRGTMKWLCAKYYESEAFLGRKESTQRVRQNILKQVCKTGGNLRFNELTRSDIAEARDRRAKTPSAAKNHMKVLSYLFDWAVDAGYMRSNPVIGVKKPKIDTKGLPPWTEDEVIAYLETHKIGSMAYLAISIFLWTGLSRADAWQIGPQHIKNGMIVWDRDKTGVPQYIPVLPPLQAAIDACPTTQLAFLLSGTGRPFKSPAALGNKFADWCREAGVNKRAHGLRKLSATLLAEGEGTHTQLKALYGWKTDKMPSYYTSSANSKKLAIQAGERLKDSVLYPHFKSGEGSGN